LLSELNRQITTLETSLAEAYQDLPDAEIIDSLPGLGLVLLGARVPGEFGDAPNRYKDARARKNAADTSPITRQSGKRHGVRPATPETVGSPTDCSDGPSAACAPPAAPTPTTTRCAPADTPTTRPYDNSRTASSGSSTAASTTAVTTTKEPPGATSSPQPLDSYPWWDI